MKNAAKLIDPVEDEDGNEEERNTGNTKDLMLDTLGVVEPGLVVVTVPSGPMLPRVRIAFERQILLGGERTGLRFPKKSSVKSLYAGNGRNSISNSLM